MGLGRRRCAARRSRGALRRIARLGTTRSHRDEAFCERAGQASCRSSRPRRLLDPSAAWQVANVLIGTPPPEKRRRRPYSVQDRHVLRLSGECLGGWLRWQTHDWRVGRGGRNGATGAVALYGRAAAAPILCDVEFCAHRQAAADPAAGRRKGTLDRKQTPSCRRRSSASAAAAKSGEALRIMFPPNGARLDARQRRGSASPSRSRSRSQVETVVLTDRARPNGMPLPENQAGRRRTLLFAPGGPGFVRLTVIDGAGATDSVMVRLQ